MAKKKLSHRPRRGDRSTLAFVPRAGFVLALSGCYGTPDGGAPLGADRELICYHGRTVQATRSGGDLVVDGDLLVAPEEQWCEGDGEGDPSGPGLSIQGRRAPSVPGTVWGASTYGVVWPNGVVPWVISSSFNEPIFLPKSIPAR